MIYRTPILEPIDVAVLRLLERQRDQLRHQVSNASTRWQGSLRRSAMARALQGSNSIEGYNADLDQAAEIVDEEKPDTLAAETYKALAGYRTSMTYIIRMHDDPHFRVDAQVIRSIHFMMLSYDLTRMPGQWRPGAIFVVNEPSGRTVYEGPSPDDVPGAIDELVDQISGPSAHESDPLILGAMAHLNLVMIHPFKDGNGRMARALQTLVISRNGILSPLFCSIEEWLGRNTQEYYEILATTGQGRWNPQNNALPWVRFCLKAHYQQASTFLRRNQEMGAVWEEITKTVVELALPTRVDSALVEAAFNFKIRNSRYRQQTEVSDVVASRDLKKLCDAGLLSPVGDKRGRHYIATPRLRDVRRKFAQPRRTEDPYDIVKTSKQLALL